MVGKSVLARQIAELEASIPRDFDPEENAQDKSGDGNTSEDGDDELVGTEHYVDVGTSKLRKPEEVTLGPQYAGSKVSRKAFEASDESDLEYEDAHESPDVESFADPETANVETGEQDGDIDSDDAFGESDEEKFKEFTFRGSVRPRRGNLMGKTKRAAEFYSDSEDDKEVEEAGLDEDVRSSGQEEEMGDSGLGDSDNEMKDKMSVDEGSDLNGPEGVSRSNSENSEDSRTPYQNEDEEEDDDDSDMGNYEDDEKVRRAELRKIMSEDQKAVVGTITQAAKIDAEKGMAIKSQMKAFDSLLNVRIRLQKALVAINSMTAVEEKDTDVSQPYKAAEEAAFKLLNTLDAMRQEFDKTSGSAKSSQKRKRTMDTDTPSSVIWQKIQDSEAASAANRQVTLDKWSSKVQGATVSRKLNNAAQATITDVLNEQLSNPERFIKRTKIPRSCAPLQAMAKVSEDPYIYDDADFYQMLLKELVDQHMMHSSLAAPIGNGGRPIEQWTAVREAKTKNNVDTKASKGRKMRFTVHEKLQNFMAPEDRGAWEQDAIDRFFGTLLGRKMSLGEEEGESEDDDGGVEVAEEALMLFRS